MKKHLESIPALVAVFYDLDWDDPLWNEKVLECKSKLDSLRYPTCVYIFSNRFETLVFLCLQAEFARLYDPRGSRAAAEGERCSNGRRRRPPKSRARRRIMPSGGLDAKDAVRAAALGPPARLHCQVQRGIALEFVFYSAPALQISIFSISTCAQTRDGLLRTRSGVLRGGGEVRQGAPQFAQ